MNFGSTSIIKHLLIRHLALPFIAPAVLIWLYLTPKTVLGCATRGYLALGVAFFATVAAITTAVIGLKEKKRGNLETANWWILTTLILLLPIILLVGPLG